MKLILNEADILRLLINEISNNGISSDDGHEISFSDIDVGKSHLEIKLVHTDGRISPLTDGWSIALEINLNSVTAS